MTIEISLDHLDIEWPANVDPDELAIDDLDHSIFEWSKDANMQVQFQIRFQEIESEDGAWDLIWSTDPRLFAVFDDQADATAFMLAWGGKRVERGFDDLTEEEQQAIVMKKLSQ